MTEPGEIAVTSQLPGTFYRRPSPDAEPFVSEGDPVEATDTIGLVEVMKSFYEIQAEHRGIVGRFLVESGDPIEAGQEIAVLWARE